MCRSCSEIHSPMRYEVTIAKISGLRRPGARPPGPPGSINCGTSHLKYLSDTLQIGCRHLTDCVCDGGYDPGCAGDDSAASFAYMEGRDCTGFDDPASGGTCVTCDGACTMFACGWPEHAALWGAGVARTDGARASNRVDSIANTITKSPPGPHTHTVPGSATSVSFVLRGPPRESLIGEC